MTSPLAISRSIPRLTRWRAGIHGPTRCPHPSAYPATSSSMDGRFPSPGWRPCTRESAAPARRGGLMAVSEPTTVSSVLDGLPVTRWHWRLVVIVGLGSFFDLYEVFLGGVLAPVLATEFKLGTTGKALVIAAGFAGMFVGANVLSIVADRLGRRRVFILNLLVYSLFSLAAAFSPNVETFLVLRFIAGIGLGAELVLVDTYLAEFVPARVRGRMTAWAYTIGFLGGPLAALLGGKLVAHHQLLGIDGWRWLLVFGGLGAVFVLAVRTMLPESPRWLESRGRDAEAREVVAAVVAKVAPGTPVPEPQTTQ